MTKTAKPTAIGRSNIAAMDFDDEISLDEHNKAVANAEEKSNRTLITSDGTKVKFKFIRLSANEVLKLSLSLDLINGRRAQDLTEASLKDIISTIRDYQFYPCFAKKNQMGEIELLDGLRRSKAARFAKVGLDILVTDYDLTSTQAKEFATQMQSGVEHTYRDLGHYYKAVMKPGQSLRDLAEIVGVPLTKVHKGMVAISIPQKIIDIFPIAHLFTVPDYKFLASVVNKLSNKGLVINDLLEYVTENYDVDCNSLTADEQKSTYMLLIKNFLVSLDEEPAKEIPFFKNNDITVEKQSSKKRIKYSFDGLTEDEAIIINDLILNKLQTFVR